MNFKKNKRYYNCVTSENNHEGELPMNYKKKEDPIIT